MATPLQPGTKLVRAIGRWGLIALMVNVVIGSGIFGLPSKVTALLGSYGPWAYLAAAAGVGVIMACFAEVASQFAEAGGPYLYARVAYGRFWGIQVGWLTWLVRLTSGAANANVFVQYLAEFVPVANQGVVRAAVLAVLLGGLAAINIRGVKAGTNVSSFFAVAKLLPLAVFIVLGLALVHGPGPASLATLTAPGAPSGKDWLSAILLLVFAYGGFEGALMPMGEARNTRRDVPFALFASLATCTVIYTLIQVVVLRALGPTAIADRPLAEAARLFLGPAGAVFLSAGALISVYGHLSSQMLNSPRLTFALAERGDFPTVFAAVSQKFHTPYISILTFAVVMYALAVGGSFTWNVILSAVARLLTYGIVCTAVLTLRRKQPHADAFRLPAAPVWSGLGVLFVLVLALRMGRGEMMAIVATMAVALANWIWARRRPSAAAGPA